MLNSMWFNVILDPDFEGHSNVYLIFQVSFRVHLIFHRFFQPFHRFYYPFFINARRILIIFRSYDRQFSNSSWQQYTVANLFWNVLEIQIYDFLHKSRYYNCQSFMFTDSLWKSFVWRQISYAVYNCNAIQHKKCLQKNKYLCTICFINTKYYITLFLSNKCILYSSKV